MHYHPDIVFAIAKARYDDLLQRAETHRRIEKLKGSNRGLHIRIASTLSNLLTARGSKLQTQHPQCLS